MTNASQSHRICDDDSSGEFLEKCPVFFINFPLDIFKNVHDTDFSHVNNDTYVGFLPELHLAPKKHWTFLKMSTARISVTD